MVPLPVTVHLLVFQRSKLTDEVVPSTISIGKLKVTLASFFPTLENVPPCMTSLEAVPIPLSEMSFEFSIIVPPFITTLPSNLKKLGVLTLTVPSPLISRLP